MSEMKVRHVRWDDLDCETVTDQIRRRMVSGDRVMVAQVYIDEGAVVPTHSHENEQFTYILEGALHFWLGEDGTEEVVVRKGEILHSIARFPPCEMSVKVLLSH